MMGLDRSPTRKSPSVSNPVCKLCAAEISTQDLYVTTCHHEFHRECIGNHFKKSESCPRCKLTCRPPAEATERVGRETRSKTKNLPAATVDGGPSTSASGANANEASSSAVSANAALLAMERRLLATLSEKMADLVQNAITSSMQRIMPTPSPAVVVTASEMSADHPNAYERQYLASPNPVPSPRSASSDLFDRPDKVVHILNGWKIKYSGVGVSVDNFIYRVEAPTRQTLNGNFNLLCRNISVLFEGKANDFFWRYHKANGEILWETFCTALRLKFRQSRDDGDIEELIPISS